MEVVPNDDPWRIIVRDSQRVLNVLTLRLDSIRSLYTGENRFAVEGRPTRHSAPEVTQRTRSEEALRQLHTRDLHRFQR